MQIKKKRNTCLFFQAIFIYTLSTYDLAYDSFVNHSNKIPKLKIQSDLILLPLFFYLVNGNHCKMSINKYINL